MSSPFPDMDPYRESPDWFPGLHDSLIIFMKGALQRRSSPSRGRIASAVTRFAIGSASREDRNA